MKKIKSIIYNFLDNYSDLTGTLNESVRFKYFKKILGNTLWLVFLTYLCQQSAYYFLDTKSIVIIPVSTYSMFGFVISLMLAFRFNSAHDRWMKGIKAWSSFEFEVHNIIMESKYDETTIKVVKGYLEVIKECVEESMNHGVDDWTLRCSRRELITIVDHPDLSDSTKAKFTLLHSYLQEIKFISSQPIPEVYSVHMKFSVYIYLLSLPFSSLTHIGLLSIIITGILSFIMNGVMVISESIEDPFSKGIDDVNLADSINSLINQYD